MPVNKAARILKVYANRRMTKMNHYHEAENFHAAKNAMAQMDAEFPEARATSIRSREFSMNCAMRGMYPLFSPYTWLLLRGICKIGYEKKTN